MTFFSEIKDFNELINSTKFFVEYEVLSSLSQEGLKKSDYIEIVITDNGKFILKFNSQKFFTSSLFFFSWLKESDGIPITNNPLSL